MSQHPNKGQVLPLEQALPLLVEMRQQGRSWPQVQHALGYSSRADLNPLRWQRAAELKRDAPTLTWASIGADPAVDFAENTLAKKHKTATLATGERWEEYFARFAEATQQALQAEAASYGQRFKRLLDGCLARVERAALRLDYFELCPEQVPAELGKDIFQPQLTLDLQVVKHFADSGQETPDPLTPAQQSWLNAENRQVLGDVERIEKLLTGRDAPADENAAGSALESPAEQLALLERTAYLHEALESNLGPARSTQQGVA